MPITDLAEDILGGIPSTLVEQRQACLEVLQVAERLEDSLDTGV